MSFYIIESIIIKYIFEIIIIVIIIANKAILLIC